MGELDILYYDYMIESMAENRKINEVLFGVELSEKINESSLILESKITDSIVAFFNKIFDRISEFFKKLVIFFTGERFKPNKKLIESCEQKLKNISAKDASNFSIEKVNGSEIIEEYTKKTVNVYSESINGLDQCMDKLEPIFKKGIGIVSGLWIASPETIDEANKILDKYSVSNIDKDKFKDVKYNDIQYIVKYYTQSGEENKAVKDLRDTIKKVEGYRRKIKLLEKFEVNGVDIAKDVQKFVSSAASLVIKSGKSIVDLRFMLFKNYESILRKFVSTESQSEAAIYFDNVLESLICDEYVSE